MAIPILPSATSASAAVGASATTKTSTTQTAGLEQNQFLQLLLTQIQNQNPLEPLNEADFTAQLATFSQLGSLQELNSSFTQMLTFQQLTQGAVLIGKQISFSIPGSNNTGKGTVDSVQVNDGKVQLMVGSQLVGLDQIVTIQSAPTNTVATK